jgi:hypothetical protein
MPDKAKAKPDLLFVSAYVTIPQVELADFDIVRQALGELLKQLPGASVTYTVKDAKAK